MRVDVVSVSFSGSGKSCGEIESEVQLVFGLGFDSCLELISTSKTDNCKTSVLPDETTTVSA